MGEHKHEKAPRNGSDYRAVPCRSRAWLAVATALLFALLEVQSARAQSSTGQTSGESDALRTGSVTGLPIPRFVSLKADRVNMRRGPSRSHQVQWVLLRAGLPVEITAEFENWRRIRDFDGDEGWVFHTLLSGRRTVLFTPWNEDDGDLVQLRRQPDQSAAVAAQVGPRVMGDVVGCENSWCEISLEEARGWATQDALWGVYPGETIN